MRRICFQNIKLMFLPASQKYFMAFGFIRRVCLWASKSHRRLRISQSATCISGIPLYPAIQNSKGAAVSGGPTELGILCKEMQIFWICNLTNIQNIFIFVKL